MKALIVVAVSCMLTGCFYQSVHNEDIENAAIICLGIENVREINVFFIGMEGVICKNMNRTVINEYSLEDSKK